MAFGNTPDCYTAVRRFQQPSSVVACHFVEVLGRWIHLGIGRVTGLASNGDIFMNRVSDIRSRRLWRLETATKRLRHRPKENMYMINFIMINRIIKFWLPRSTNWESSLKPCSISASLGGTLSRVISLLRDFRTHRLSQYPRKGKMLQKAIDATSCSEAMARLKRIVFSNCTH